MGFGSQNAPVCSLWKPVIFTATFRSLTLLPSPASVLDTFEILHHSIHKSCDLSACFRLVGIKMLRLLFFFFKVLLIHNYTNNILGSDSTYPPLLLLIHPFQVPFSSTTSHSSFVCLFDAMLRLIRVVCISV